MTFIIIRFLCIFTNQDAILSELPIVKTRAVYEGIIQKFEHSL